MFKRIIIITILSIAACLTACASNKEKIEIHTIASAESDLDLDRIEQIGDSVYIRLYHGDNQWATRRFVDITSILNAEEFMKLNESISSLGIPEMVQKPWVDFYRLTETDEFSHKVVAANEREIEILDGREIGWKFPQYLIEIDDTAFIYYPKGFDSADIDFFNSWCHDVPNYQENHVYARIVYNNSEKDSISDKQLIMDAQNYLNKLNIYTQTSIMPDSITLQKESPELESPEAKTWQEAYESFLREVETYDYKNRDYIIPGSYDTPPLFYLYDIDKNGTPELILISDNGEWDDITCEVFTFNKSFKKLGNMKFNFFGQVGAPNHFSEGLFSDISYKGHDVELYYYTIKNDILAEQLFDTESVEGSMQIEYTCFDFYPITEENIRQVILKMNNKSEENSNLTEISWKAVCEDGEGAFDLYVIVNNKTEYYAGNYWPGGDFEFNESSYVSDAPENALQTISTLWTGEGQWFYIYQKNETELAVMNHPVLYPEWYISSVKEEIGEEEYTKQYDQYQEIAIIPIEKNSLIKMTESILIIKPEEEPAG